MSVLCVFFDHDWVWCQNERLFGAGYSGYVIDETTKACSRCGNFELIMSSMRKKYPNLREHPL